MDYDVFISYRRSSFESANLIAEKLRSMGYRVFFDVETLRSGKFNEQLFQVIENCADFIVVLPPNSLDRCHNEEDWVRKEVLYAMNKKKNIVPVMLAGFEWPSPMPTGMEELCYYQAITAGEKEFFDMSMKRLASYLKAKPHKNLRVFYRKITVVVASIILFLGTGWIALTQMAKSLCYDIGVSMTLEMEILDALRANQINHNKLWKQYIDEVIKPNVSEQEIKIATEWINESINAYEKEIQSLHGKVDKYMEFTAFQKFLLSFYDFTPQDISAFSAFFDVLFQMALNNASYLKSVASSQMNEFTVFITEKHFEGWQYPYMSLYYNYMAEMSKMPRKAQEYYYANATFTTITNPITLHKDQKEYERLATEEMAKYQNIAKDIQMSVEKLKITTMQLEAK